MTGLVATALALLLGVAAQTGLVAAVPTPLSALALACLLLAVQLQVRVIEEPHLRRLHGAAYAAYAARVGRFLPRVARLGGGVPAGR